MLNGANVTVCSEIFAKHINKVWQNAQFLIGKPAGALHNQQALKG
jgi:hypothetical protein